MKRHQNHGIRKVCGCARRKWAKCGHSWHFNFKVKGGESFRFSVDSEAGKHIEDKADAEALGDQWRAAIRAGTFRRREATQAEPVTTPAALTFEQFAEKWQASRVDVSESQRSQDAAVCKRLSAAALLDGQRFGDKPIGALTEDDFEIAISGVRTLAASSWNKYRQTIRHLQRWGQRKGYLTRPFVSDETLDKGGALGRRKGAKRTRRLVADVVDEHGKVTEPGEEARLQLHASPWMQRLIIAALETGCRRGELLSLQWQDVDRARAEFHVRAEKAKSREGRTVPISPRLDAVLEMVKNDPAGKPHKPTAYVFGNTVGEKVDSPKKAWETLVLKAHGYTPKWDGSRLSAESRAQYAAADLHFHDLRHEAGSRMLEAGMPLHHVQAWLGHAQASTTSTYLNVTGRHLQDSMRRYIAPLQTVAKKEEINPSPICNAEPNEDANVVVN